MQGAEKSGNILTEYAAELEQYGKEDFLYGDAVYDLLNELALSYPLYREQLEESTAVRGKVVGLSKQSVRNIIKQRRKLIPLAGSDTVSAWDGQPFPIKVGNYILDGDSIREQSGMITIPVCSHPIMTSRRYIDIESGEESVELSYRRDNAWRRVTVEKSLISDAGKIVPLSGKGISVTSENARALVRYISFIDDRNRDIIPIERISTHVGWVGEGQEFVPYAPGISYGGPESFRQMYDTITAHGDYKTWLDTVKAVRKEEKSVPARIALAASFASPLLIKNGALSFIVHLWSARSGSGKTVTLELAASVWGKPDVGDYVKSMKATTVAIEQLAVFCRHLPLCLDELQTIQTQDRFDELIYMLCEGHGKERGARNGGLRTTSSWRNITITTGEMPIIGSASKAGSVNRVIEVEGQSDMLEQPRRVAGVIQSNYGFAGKAFIEALDGREEEMLRLFQGFEDELAGKCTAKQALSAAILLTGDWLSEKLIFRDGITLGVEDLLPYLKTDRDVDTNRRAHEWLLGWISENYTSFVREGSNGEELPEQGFKALGKIEKKMDGGRVAWINRKICAETLNANGFNFKSYMSWAKARGLLDRREQKGHEYDPNIGIRGGNVIRCTGILIDKEFDRPNVMEPVQHDRTLPW